MQGMPPVCTDGPGSQNQHSTFVPDLKPTASSVRPALSFRSRKALSVAGITLCALAFAAAAQAQMITVPNGSFESQLADPGTDVTTNIDNWQKTAQPVDFTSPNGYTWDQQMGIFGNTPAGYPNHIDNVDGSQSAYLFDVPGVGLFQDYNSTDWQNATPTHAFNASYLAGKAYTLTIGVVGGGGHMQPGAVLDLILYYRDGNNNIVPIADTPITYTTDAFPTTTHLVDYQVNVPTVQATDAWAGQNIGVELLSTEGEGYGYWDVDNVRLTPTPEPTSAALLLVGLCGAGLRRHRRQPVR